jgi:hypothetical protein
MVSVKPTTDINKEKSYYKNIINKTKTKTIGLVLIVVSCIALILLRYLKENKNSYFCPPCPGYKGTDSFWDKEEEEDFYNLC